VPKLFSYVVEHDRGLAPCPVGGYCTLVKCKYGSAGYRNIVELAQVGDWIAGTGGARKSVSAGHRRLIYAMRVDEKLSFSDYSRDPKFSNRLDAKRERGKQGRFALISRHFFYFGRNAIDISEIPSRNLRHRFEKKGPGFRKDFTEHFIEDFAGWLENNFNVGRHGPHCGPLPEDQPKRLCRVRRC
jgi:hypothetical protein